MAGLNVDTWVERFEAAAEEDGYFLMEEFCSRFPIRKGGTVGQCVSVETVMAGTVRFVRWLCVDGDRLLRMQTYDPEEAKKAKYAVLVHTGGLGWSRILCETLDFTDLADLHALQGLKSLRIGKIDGSPLRVEDPYEIVNCIEDDLHFDFGPSEVKIAYRCFTDRIVAKVWDEHDGREFGPIKEGVIAWYLNDEGCRGGKVLKVGNEEVVLSLGPPPGVLTVRGVVVRRNGFTKWLRSGTPKPVELDPEYKSAKPATIPRVLAKRIVPISEVTFTFEGLDVVRNGPRPDGPDVAEDVRGVGKVKSSHRMRLESPILKRAIAKPTPKRILSALSQLDHTADDPYIILVDKAKDNAFMQAIKKSKTLFFVEYRDPSSGRQFSTHKVPLRVAEKLFLSYLSNDGSFKIAVKWQDMPRTP